MTLVALLVGFVAWLEQFQQYGSADRPEVDATCAMVVMLVALTIAKAARAFGIPWIVIGTIALGIAVFGW